MSNSSYNGSAVYFKWVIFVNWRTSTCDVNKSHAHLISYSVIVEDPNILSGDLRELIEENDVEILFTLSFLMFVL